MWHIVLPLALYILISCPTFVVTTSSSTCSWQNYVFANEINKPLAPFCPTEISQLRNAIYILYDVNYPEGFNLRRDVYIRLAVFVQHLQRRQLFRNVRLVLPPWPRLFHWKSRHLHQENLPWSTFFDIASMQRYAPILDYPEFLQEIAQFGLPESPNVLLDKVFQLQHFEEMFENGVFLDKFEIQRDDCNRVELMKNSQLLQQTELVLRADNNDDEDSTFVCVRFQGSVNILERVLRQFLNKKTVNDAPKVYAILNAEIVLHEYWGGVEFWRARRSMRFAAPLEYVAKQFRLQRFNSTNEYDLVQRPAMWEMEQPKRNALGGDYLCAHLRRGDFVYGREDSTPTLESTATQIRQILQAHNLTHVFLATDANVFEVKNLKSYLFRVHVVRFSAETLNQKAIIKDGGIAIIDQSICAHARHFIGTYLSTFTYRIYEEREILGFRKSTTFNTFCKSATLQNCTRNSIWPIVY